MVMSAGETKKYGALIYEEKELNVSRLYYLMTSDMLDIFSFGEYPRNQLFFKIYENGILNIFNKNFYYWDGIDEICFNYEPSFASIRHIDIILKKDNKCVVIVPTNLNKTHLPTVKSLLEKIVTNKKIKITVKTGLYWPIMYFLGYSIIALLTLYGTYLGKLHIIWFISTLIFGYAIFSYTKSLFSSNWKKY
jgi:hypothetical protein